MVKTVANNRMMKLEIKTPSCGEDRDSNCLWQGKQGCYWERELLLLNNFNDELFAKFAPRRASCSIRC